MAASFSGWDVVVSLQYKSIARLEPFSIENDAVPKLLPPSPVVSASQHKEFQVHFGEKLVAAED